MAKAKETKVEVSEETKAPPKKRAKKASVPTINKIDEAVKYLAKQRYNRALPNSIPYWDDVGKELINNGFVMIIYTGKAELLSAGEDRVNAL